MAKPRVLPLLLMTCVLFLGCSDDSTEVPEAELTNPASTYCVQNGGRSELVSEPSGQWRKCTFFDGSWCDEMAFYKGECRKGQNKP